MPVAATLGKPDFRESFLGKGDEFLMLYDRTQRNEGDGRAARGGSPSVFEDSPTSAPGLTGMGVPHASPAWLPGTEPGVAMVCSRYDLGASAWGASAWGASAWKHTMGVLRRRRRRGGAMGVLRRKVLRGRRERTGLPERLLAPYGGIPVLLWVHESSPPEARMFKKVLVPIDGSPHARMALDLALELLDDDGASLILLTVPEGSPNAADLVRWTGGSGDGSDPESLEESLRRTLMDLAEEIARPGLVVRSELFWSPPAQAIIETAQTHDVDAIIMGSRGRSDLASLVLGSTSHRVLHTADRRVLIVR